MAGFRLVVVVQRYLPGMSIQLFSLALLMSLAAACGSSSETASTPAATVAATPQPDPDPPALGIMPIQHATFVLTAGDQVIYNDPVGGPEAFASIPAPTIVLVSDIHGDHLDSATLEALVTEEVSLVVPDAVAERLSPKLAAQATVLANGASITVNGIGIEAIPMYNLREEALKFHTKGRGNGYVLTVAGERIYIAGDTEDIPEMRALQNIDRAFVPMNLPYTMPVAAAADAVLAFAPRIVYPYHFRGKGGLSDTAQFRALVEGATDDVRVVGLSWYPPQD